MAVAFTRVSSVQLTDFI